MNNFRGVVSLALRTKIEQLDAELIAAKRDLNILENDCPHTWGITEEAHIHHDGYSVRSDAPIEKGSDWSGPYYVQARTENRWKRECKQCGKIEYTFKSEDSFVQKPIF